MFQNLYRLEPEEQLRRYRAYARVWIPDIEPDQLCTLAQAEEYAKERIAGLLCGLDDYEILSMDIEEVKGWDE